MFVCGHSETRGDRLLSLALVTVKHVMIRPVFVCVTMKHVVIRPVFFCGHNETRVDQTFVCGHNVLIRNVFVCGHSETHVDQTCLCLWSQ